jgi:hypothetical protein
LVKSPEMVIPAALLVGQIVVSAFFLLAAVGKILSSSDFSDALRASGLPERLIGPVAFSITLSELCVSVAVLFGDRFVLLGAFSGAILLLVIFTSWVMFVNLRGLRLRCGCFGSGRAEISRKTVLRNLALLAVTAISLFLSSQPVVAITPRYSLSLLAGIIELQLVVALTMAAIRARSQLALTGESIRRRQDAWK